MHPSEIGRPPVSCAETGGLCCGDAGCFVTKQEPYRPYTYILDSVTDGTAVRTYETNEMPPKGAACRLFWAWADPLLFLPHKPDPVYGCRDHRFPGAGSDSLLNKSRKVGYIMKIVVVRCTGVTNFLLRKMFKIKKAEV